MAQTSNLVAEGFEPTEDELELYEQGRLLRTVNPRAWEIIFSTVNAYRDTALKELMKLPPGDPTVPTVHAAASALEDFASKFPQDVQKAIDAAAKPSPELQSYLIQVRDNLDVARAMEKNS